MSWHYLRAHNGWYWRADVLIKACPSPEIKIVVRELTDDELMAR